MTAPVSPFRLDKRIALVTGSSRGIGLALARALGEAGATVVLNGRDAATLDRSYRALLDEGIMAHQRAFDVCDESEVTDAVADIEAAVGPIEILINNAGIQRRAPFLEFPLATYRELMEVNLVAPFIVGKAVAAAMVTRGHGKIINVCSIQSELGRATIAPYTATKGGLKMLTRGMCADLGPRGIQVNAIAPGYFATDLTAALVADEEFSAWVGRRTPAGRWGRPEELGGAAVFLASDASSFVNGQIIHIDGGMTAVV